MININSQTIFEQSIDKKTITIVQKSKKTNVITLKVSELTAIISELNIQKVRK